MANLWNDLTVTPLRTIRVGEAGAIEINEDPDAFDNVWLSVSSGTSVILYGVAWNGTRAVAVGAAGTVLASDDQGLTWYPATSGVTVDLYALDVGDNVFVAVGELGVILTSQTGLSWEPVDSGTFWNLWDVSVLNAEYTAVGDNDVIVVGSLVSTLLDIVVAEAIATAEDSNSQGILNSSADDGLTFDEAVSRETFAPVPVLVAVTERFSFEEDGATDVGGVVETGFDETTTNLDAVITEQLAMDEANQGQYQGDMAELFFMFLDDSMALSSVQSTDQMIANSDAVDSFSLHDRPFLNNDALIEAFALSSTLVGAYGKTILDALGVNDTAEANQVNVLTLIDSFATSGSVKGDVAVTLLEAFGINARPFINNEEVYDSVALHSLLTDAFGREVLEALTVSAAMLDQLLANDVLTELFTVSGTVGQVVSIAITVPEHVALSDTAGINQIINSLVNEGITFSAALILDNETYLAWVMNTETYGVTNYENFRFNSMCGFNGAYYATDGTKIYRLDGQTDDGTAIDAEISLGASDFGSAFLKRMERAYLGLRADGQMVLKVVTDEKVEDWYTLESVPSALGESHVKIGKGLKARYWRLALRNKGGSDFTLDSLRLLPLKLSRRV